MLGSDALEKGEKCSCVACQADKIAASDGCLSRVDDDYDCTYCTFKFKVPEKWQKDYDLVIVGKIKETSNEYKDLVLSTLKLEEVKEKIKKVLY